MFIEESLLYFCTGCKTGNLHKSSTLESSHYPLFIIQKFSIHTYVIHKAHLSITYSWDHCSYWLVHAYLNLLCLHRVVGGHLGSVPLLTLSVYAHRFSKDTWSPPSFSWLFIVLDLSPHWEDVALIIEALWLGRIFIKDKQYNWKL